MGDTRNPVFNDVPAAVVWLTIAIAVCGVAAELYAPFRDLAFEWGAFFPVFAFDRPGAAPAIAPWFLHVFVHGSWMHLVMNTLALLAFGAASARRATLKLALALIAEFRVYQCELWLGDIGDRAIDRVSDTLASGDRRPQIARRGIGADTAGGGAQPLMQRLGAGSRVHVEIAVFHPHGRRVGGRVASQRGAGNGASDNCDRQRV